MKDTNKFLNSFYRIANDCLKQLLIIIFYIFTIIGLQLFFIKELRSTDMVIVNVVSTLIELIILTAFVIIFRKKLVPDFDDFKKNGKEYIKKYYHYYLIGLVIMVISNIVIGLFINPSTNETLNRDYLFKLPVYSIISMVIIAPIIEECMTRAILKDTFKTSFIYYLLSALTFGGLHLLNATSILEVLYLIPYGALGFVFAIMYKKSNNIWTSIFFHFFHNLIAILIIFKTM